jgi:hypothetical protein
VFELLRPPGHRGPLIAAGAVLLTVGLALVQIRIHPARAAQLALAGVPALLLLWLAVQAPLIGGRPRAHESVLIACGLLLFAIAEVRLAQLLGADFGDPVKGATAWTALMLALLAASIAVRRLSAFAVLVAALALDLSAIAAYNAIFEPHSSTPFRWVLLILALTYALASLPLRGVSLRHAEQMINAAGLSILATAVMQAANLFEILHLPGFWEFVLLAAGCSLVAYAGADRAPGPAYIGAANLLAFTLVVASGDDLKWWPLTLLVLGAAVMAAGLRPRKPLPPEPDGYGVGDLPLAARADADVSVRVQRID